MAFPLVGVLFAAGLLNQERKGRRDRELTADQRELAQIRFGTARQAARSLATGPLTADQDAFAAAQFALDPQAGVNALSTFLASNNQAKRDVAQQLDKDQDQDLALDKFAFEKDKQETSVRQWEQTFANANDPAHQRRLAFAKQTGQVPVFDPRSGLEVLVAAPGSEGHIESQEAARSATLAGLLWDELTRDVLINGSKFSKDRTGKQGGLATRALFHIKRAEAGGALDQGMIDVAAGLIGDQGSITLGLFGNDAEAGRRLLSYATEIGKQQRNALTGIQLLPGLDEDVMPGLMGSMTRLNILQQQAPQRLQFLDQQGGTVGGEDQTFWQQFLRGDHLPGFLQLPARQIPGAEPGRPRGEGVELTRGTGRTIQDKITGVLGNLGF
jgi:hypothetical protein